MKRVLSLALLPLLAGCGGSIQIGNHTYDTSSLNGVFKAGNALRKSAADISESEEYFIGRAVSAQILAKYKPNNDAALNHYLQEMLQAVAGASERPATFKGYHIQVLQSSELNAFSAPGGFVFVTTGLLKAISDEEELAAVLGHEVAHVARKHGLQTIRTARLTSAFTILGGEVAKRYTPEQLGSLTEHFGGAVDDIVGKLVISGYSRDKEFEADEYGAKFAVNANFAKGGMQRFLKSLQARQGSSGGLLKTHPAAADRLSKLGGGSSGSASSERTQRFRAAVASL